MGIDLNIPDSIYYFRILYIYHIYYIYHVVSGSRSDLMPLSFITAHVQLGCAGAFANLRHQQHQQLLDVKPQGFPWYPLAN